LGFERRKQRIYEESSSSLNNSLVGERGRLLVYEVDSNTHRQILD
jgi:hypothetical protein